MESDPFQRLDIFVIFFETIYFYQCFTFLKQDLASFIFTLQLIGKWQRHPAADLRGWKPLLQFTIFSFNKSVNYFCPKMKDAQGFYLKFDFHAEPPAPAIARITPVDIIIKIG